MKRFFRRLALRPTLLVAFTMLWSLIALPAQAAVTITFWSHELGNSFPHAFITLRGVPDAGGDPIDSSFGFTAKSVSPALLFGTVAGKVERPTIGYMNGSDAQFSVTLTDAQYAAELALLAAWDPERGGDGQYSLNQRNCVHFVKEAARIAGLSGLDQPSLMKKPRSYLKTVAAANSAAITIVAQHGKDYLATLPPVAGPTVAGRDAPDLHVLPPAAPGQPIGTISTTSSVASNPG